MVSEGDGRRKEEGSLTKYEACIYQHIYAIKVQQSFGKSSVTSFSIIGHSKIKQVDCMIQDMTTGRKKWFTAKITK